MSALTFLESTTNSNESHIESQRSLEASFAGMETGTVLLVPRGLSQAAACDGDYYQIPAHGDNTNPMPAYYQFRIADSASAEPHQTIQKTIYNLSFV